MPEFENDDSSDARAAGSTASFSTSGHRLAERFLGTTAARCQYRLSLHAAGVWVERKAYGWNGT